jgi:hypothetical protein
LLSRLVYNIEEFLWNILFIESIPRPPVPMSFSKSAETRLYREYLQLFRNEIESVVNRTTPYLISCILSRCIKNKGASSSIMETKFPDLSITYVKGVIKSMKSMRMTATLSNTDCVFFVRDDSTPEADYTRGLVAFHIIADVISSGVIDLSYFLPRSYEKTLGEIAGIPTNRYKLRCSRTNYIESMSTELMELVTVMLPKTNKLLQKASRVNAAATPSQSRLTTPILFLGSMMALAGGVAAEAASTGPSQMALKVTEGSSGSGSAITTETNRMNRAVNKFMEENTVLQKRVEKNKIDNETSRENNLALIEGKMHNWFGDFKFALSPLDDRSLAPEWVIESNKISAWIANKADNFARNGGMGDDQFRTTVSEGMGKYIEALRAFDVNVDILITGVDGGYTLALPIEEVRAAIQPPGEAGDGTSVSDLSGEDLGNLQMSPFLNDVSSGLGDILTAAVNTNIERSDRIREIDDKLLEIEVTDKVAGIKTVTTKDQAQKLREERLSLTASSLLKLDQGSVDDIMTNLGVMSLVMNVVPNKEIVAFSLPCPDGTRCEPFTIIYADPTTSGLVEVAEKVISLQTNIAPSDSPFVNVVEVRSSDQLRRFFSGKNGVDVDPFATYIESANKAAVGHNLGVKNSQIQADDFKGTANLVVQHLSKYQRLNNPHLPDEEVNNTALLLWNGFNSINPQEIMSTELMTEFMKKMMPTANDMESLLETLKDIVGAKHLDTDESDLPDNFYAEVKSMAPSLVKELIRGKMRENGVDPDAFNSAAHCVSKDSNCKFKEFLGSPASKLRLKVLKGTHAVKESWAIVRWISWWKSDNAMEPETVELLENLEKSLSDYTLKDGEEMVMNEKEIDSFLKLMEFIALSGAGKEVPRGGDPFDTFIFYVEMMIKDWVTAVEGTLFVLACGLVSGIGRSIVKGIIKGVFKIGIIVPKNMVLAGWRRMRQEGQIG